ncbi:MAG: hypothetical protein HRT74_03435 [Flavobacteriales bacterium]|nr:hypothetical protein [Flavobacteriales bacterium]
MKLNSLKFLFSLAVFSALFCTMSFKSYAQSDDTPQPLYIETSNLDPYKFKDLVLHFRDVPGIELEQACVPAQVLKVETNEALTETEVSELLESIKSVGALNSVVLLEQFSEEDYQTRCSSVR